MGKIDPRVAEKIREDIEKRGDFTAAFAHNRTTGATSLDQECGGCFGAGLGARCCMCGGKR